MSDKRQIKREIVNLEQRANKSSVRVSKMQKLATEKIRKEITAKATDLAATKLNSPFSVEVSIKQAELTELVRESFNTLTAAQQKQVNDLLSKVYTDTRTGVANLLESSFEVTNKFQLNQLLSRVDGNTTLSKRIWTNNAAISQRINNDISRLLYNDATPDQIKRALAADFNISYNAADRLIRTETSKFYNAAAIDSYKEAGVEEIEWLTEKDDRTCRVCGPKNGLRYPVSMPPEIPAHPRCRCVILPVIK